MSATTVVQRKQRKNIILSQVNNEYLCHYPRDLIERYITPETDLKVKVIIQLTEIVILPSSDKP